ncbi:MAG TPA: hypothetical protein VFG35_13515 [Actinoplanes sp.]|nr:hypothetical protein [Actinoplanes sp.]
MSAPLNRLLQHVLEGEPPLGDEVDAIFRRADRLRRRRTRTVLGAGAATVGLIAALGYVLTATLLSPPPVTITPPAVSAIAAPSPVLSRTPAPAPALADGVLAVIEPLLEGRKLTIVPGSAERGPGWRQYRVTEGPGRPRGTIVVAVFDVGKNLDARKKWCFPVAADLDECARPDRAHGLESVRYDDVSDPDRQVRQTVARRLGDGRVLAVLAVGKRNVGAQRGKPALTGTQVEKVATDERVFDAFRRTEGCDDLCPSLNTPVTPR